MEWAEEFGVGELGLSPEAFWSLTLREFWIKHAAFSRAEDRALSRVYTLANLTGTFRVDERRKLKKAESALRRYPVKKWLLPNGEGQS